MLLYLYIAHNAQCLLHKYLHWAKYVRIVLLSPVIRRVWFAFLFMGSYAGDDRSIFGH